MKKLVCTGGPPSTATDSTMFVAIVFVTLASSTPVTRAKGFRIPLVEGGVSRQGGGGEPGLRKVA